MDKLVLIWAVFWGDVNTPSNFANDWYGGVTNQIGHVMLGLFAVCAICVAYAVAFGEMPWRGPVGMGIIAVYFFGIELWRQKWQGADTIVDTCFVALGVIAPLVSLHEVAFSPAIKLQLDIYGLAISMTAIVIGLAGYAYPRIDRGLK